VIPVSHFSLHAPLADALASMPAIITTGMRQTGKSPFLQHDAALAKHAYASPGDFTKLRTVRSAPEAFIDRKAPLTVDEAQRGSCSPARQRT
jgi:uncharacterized protein